MSVKARELVDFIEDLAPQQLQEEWDNSGLQIGSKETEIRGILLSMDISDKSVDFAIENNLNFLFSHHPFFFEGVKSIDFSTYKGKLIKKIIENNLFLYSSHTSLDKAKLGVNQVLANKLGLINTEMALEYIEDEIGVIGEIENKSLDDLIKNIDENILPKEKIKMYGRQKNKLEKILVIGGSGSYAIDMAKKLGCNCLVTADIKHHDGQKAYEEDLMLIDLGHFYSEFPVLEMLKKKFEEKFDGINTKIFTDPVFIIE